MRPGSILDGTRLLAGAILATALSGCLVLADPTAQGRNTLAVGHALEPLRLPYGQLNVMIDGGTPGRMLLASSIGDYDYWLAADGQALWLRDGRIVGTQGLPRNLAQMQVIAGRWPDMASVIEADSVEPASATVYFESDAPGGLGRIAEINLKATGNELVVAAAGRALRLEQLVEDFEVPATGERWRNEYWWHEPSRRLIAAQQRIAGTPYQVRFSRPLYGIPSVEE